MRLIAILLSLWLDRHRGRFDHWRGPEPFFRYAARAYELARPRHPGAGVGPFLMVLAPPIVIAAFLQWLFSGWLLGLVNLVFGVIALLYAHGPGSIDDQVQAFARAWREGRAEDARTLAAALSGRDEPPEASAALPAHVVEGMFWQSYRRVFACVFWYALLGPVGALLVPVAELTRQFAAQQGEPAEAMEQTAFAFLHALDWLPARALAVALGLAGSFVHAVGGWKDSLNERDEGARSLVVKAALGALNEPTYVAEPEAVEELLADARSLLTRSLMVWLAVVALLTIAGMVP